VEFSLVIKFLRYK